MISWIDNKFYKEFDDNWDDHIFREKILLKLQHDYKVLDIGAGAGIVEAMRFRGLTKQIYGIDLDPRVKSNCYLDKGILADAEDIPFEDGSFDLVFADNVMEHIENPYKVLTEISRVLKPNGVFLFKTPNRFHYMPLIARITPISFHKYINRMRGRESADTFPTFYRANSKSQLFDLTLQTDFTLNSLEFIEGRPEYLRFTFLTYLFGLLYERFVNSSDMFSAYRVLIIAELHKKT